MLVGAGTPLAPHDVARAFMGKRAASLLKVLDALAGIGMPHRLEDGRDHGLVTKPGRRHSAKLR